MVDRFCIHDYTPISVLLYHDRKRTWAAFKLILRGQYQRFGKRWLKMPIQNFVLMEYCLFPSRRRRFREHALRILKAQVNRKGVYWRHLNHGYMWFCFMLPPESAFCSNHDRKRTLSGVPSVLKRRNSKISMEQQLCLTTFENADFGLKVKHGHPVLNHFETLLLKMRVLNAVN